MTEAVVGLGQHNMVSLGGTTDSSGNPAGNMTGELSDAITGVKRYQVAPTLTGVATPEVIADASASNTVLSAIAVFNALDNVTAGDAVKNRYPDVKRIELDEAISIQSDDNITKVWVLAFGTADNTGGNVIAEATTTGATIRAALLEFTFEAVDEVKTVEISLGSKKTSGTAVVPSQYATIRVEGYSHA